MSKNDKEMKIPSDFGSKLSLVCVWVKLNKSWKIWNLNLRSKKRKRHKDIIIRFNLLSVPEFI
jgi:hypothetical protein